MRHPWRSACFGVLLIAFSMAEIMAESARDSALDLGIRQNQDGDYETAVFTLDSVVRRLSGLPTRKSDLVTAYVHLGVAYLGLEHESAAKGKFRAALKLDPRYKLAQDEFSPRAIRLFENERSQLAAKRKMNKARWLTIMGVGGAGAAVVTAMRTEGEKTAPANRPPNQPFISVSPLGTMIVGVTTVTMTASATDPDGDPIVYAWDLGDGTTASGETVRHVYQKEGVFNAQLTATDTKDTKNTTAASVTVRSLTGTWGTSTTCTQNGTEFNCDSGSGKKYITFRVVDPRRLVDGVYYSSGCPCQGEVRPDLDYLWFYGLVSNDSGRCAVITGMSRVKQ